MKKVLIEIPDEFENDLKDKFNDFFGRVRADLGDYSETLLCGNYEMETIDMFLKSFDSSKVLSEMTNGEVIKALFPSASETDHFILNSPIGNIIYIRLEKYQEMRVQQDWWNAPYKKEVE